ncbi:MAG: sigma-54-dependent Fis family transcriptional regulator [Planctomycetes bacterium]|nr:sigma-54-dependent Fis family transcriptional regulator [Planctomycetota bacterium]
MAERITVLVVDDEGDVRASLEMILQYEGYDVWTARGGEEALARLTREEQGGKTAAVVLCDVKMPRMDGIETLEKLLARPAPPAVIMISGHGDIQTAVEAVKKGAVDFLEKPLEQNRVLVSIANALREKRLATENKLLRRKISERWELVGETPALAALREQIGRVASSNASVLITGENGTGKEIVARQIHLSSARAAGPFVTVNCAAIPAELIESEFFGHEKGSFTGAHERRIGHFEAASGGTLFLDEIGDMPLNAQAKVLRVLETHEVTRVGSSKPSPIDLRVISATNADLQKAVEEKLFRLDLFYRLNVVPLRVPPLRERLDDVQRLATHFLREIAERTGRAPHHLAPDALNYLRSLDFPGNVRQLRNVLEAATVFAEASAVERVHLERVLANGPGLAATTRALDPASDPFHAPTFEAFKDQSEALFFKRKLAEYGGNVKRTAEMLAMQRSHLYKKLDRYGLKN